MPASFARLRVLMSVLLLGVLSCHAGFPHGKNYQTIQASPHRNTKAASKWNRLGLLCLEQGHTHKAENSFQRALIEDVSYGPAHNNLGKLYFDRGEYYLAAWEYEYAAKLMPQDGAPLNNLGMVYEAADRFGDAIDYYEQARLIAPDDPEYLSNLTRARIRRGDLAPDVVPLLEEVVWRDSRPDWRNWAEELLHTRFKDWHEQTQTVSSGSARLENFLPAQDELGTEIYCPPPASEPLLVPESPSVMETPTIPGAHGLGLPDSGGWDSQPIGPPNQPPVPAYGPAHVPTQRPSNSKTQDGSLNDLPPLPGGELRPLPGAQWLPSHPGEETAKPLLGPTSRRPSLRSLGKNRLPPVQPASFEERAP